MAVLKNDRLRESAAYCVVAVGSALIAILPYLMSPGAYLRDDMQAQYAPTFVAIGRSLAAGHWPDLTLQIVGGGALLGEYQYALLNPVSLLSYVLMAQFSDLAAAAAAFVAIHSVILGAGAYSLARSLTVQRRFALVAALAFAANNYVFYWFSSSWAPGLVGTAWLVWAIALLLRSHEGRFWWAGSTLATYLLFSAGWPQGDVAFAICVAVLLAVRLKQNGLIGGAPAALSLLTSFAGALSSLLPLGAMVAGGERSSMIHNEAFLEPNLSGVLAISSPAHTGFMQSFSGNAPIYAPMFYAAWFILPMSCFFDWDVLRRSRRLWILLAIAATFALMTQGPQQLFSLRWPFRFLPYMHLSVLMAFALAATEGGFILSRRRMAFAFALVGFGLVASAQAQPDSVTVEFVFTLIVAVLVAATAWLSARSRVLDAVSLTLGVFAIFGLTHQVWPRNENLGDWRQPRAVGAVADLAAIPGGYGLTAGVAGDLPFDARPPPFGNMGLTSDKPYFFGYSPIGLRAASEMFCVETYGLTCPTGTGRFFSVAMGDATWADLMKIDEIIFLPSRHPHPPPIAQQGWTCAPNAGLDGCERTAPRHRYPGSVSFVSPGMALQSVGPQSATHEALLVKAPLGGEVVFARLAWTGYRAMLGGGLLPIDRIGPGLVGLRIPPSEASRTLVLSYAPPGLFVSIAAAVCGLLMLIAGVLGWPYFGRIGLAGRRSIGRSTS